MEIFLAVAGIGLSVIGIPLAFYLARRGRRRPVLRLAADFDLIVSQEQGAFHAGVLRTSNGLPVTRISRTWFAIWNHQGDTIRGADIVPDDRLRIQLDRDDTPLLVRVAARSRRQNKLEVSVSTIDSSCVDVDFDFLDSGDGGVIEVIHQSIDRPQMVGTIRGASLGFRGTVALSPRVVSDMSQPWRKRKSVHSRAASLTFVFMVSLTMIFFGMSTYADGQAALAATPEMINDKGVVDATKFDLNSTEGQQDFSEVVSARRYGNFPFLQIMSIFVFLAGVLVPIVAIISLAKRGRGVPPSIARILENVDTNSDSQESYTSGPRDGEQN